MKTLSGLSVVLIFAVGLWAQNRSGFVNTGPVIRQFPSVIYPGGTSALPGVQRTTGSVLFPGGGTQIGVPAVPFKQPNVFDRPFDRQGNGFGFGRQGFNNNNGNNGRFNNTYAYPVAVPVPVYVGGSGYEDPSAYGYGYGPAGGPAMAPQSQPNVIVIYPQGPGYGAMPPPQPARMMPPGQGAEPSAATTDENPSHYLIALKDHSIYSAIAYWVNGDTLHYFTAANTHNEVSLALVDRDLTRRLNEETGFPIKLPPVK